MKILKLITALKMVHCYCFLSEMMTMDEICQACFALVIVQGTMPTAKSNQKYVSMFSLCKYKREKIRNGQKPGSDYVPIILDAHCYVSSLGMFSYSTLHPGTKRNLRATNPSNRTR